MTIIHINPVYPWHCGGTDGLTTTNEKDVNCPNCNKRRLPVEYGNYMPSFPRTNFADTTNIHDQVRHVLSEAHEAWTTETFDHMAEELMDVIHSAETALHILSEKYDINPTASKIEVIEKNRVRGYY